MEGTDQGISEEELNQLLSDMDEMPDEELEYLGDEEMDDDDVDESAHPGEMPETYVARVARAKAEHGWRTVLMRRLVPQIVLAADTTLEFAGEIIGQPVDADDARAILRRLAGQKHRVLTCVAMA